MTSAVVSEEQVLTSSMHKLQVSIMRGDHAQDDDNQSEATEVTCKTPTCSLPPPQLQEPPRSAPRSAPLRKRMPPRGGGRAAAAAVPRKSRPPSIFQNATILRAPPKQRGMPILKTTTAGNADNDDDTSMSLDLRSKPGVIGFFAQAEEDFENFHEVDDDDHLDALHDFHQSHNSGGTSSTTRPTSSCGALGSTAGHSNSGGTCTCCSSPKRNSPPTTAAIEPLTEERVRAFLRDYYEDFDSIFRLGKSTKAVWDSFFAQYFTPEIRWVRSSSNSLTGPELADHFAKDIVGIRMKLVSIDSLQILTLGVSAVVTFTADQMFEYRGTPNSDRTVLTMVLNVVHGNEIRIAHEHRCTGVPIPQDATWD